MARRQRPPASVPVPVGVVLAVLPLYGVWALWLATSGGDLAAQVAWAQFARAYPDSAYNLSWYGGMHVANYSLLVPHLMSWAGLRAVGVCAGLAATWAVAALVCRIREVRAAFWPALLGGVAVWCNIASGRVTFAVGLAAAALAVLWATSASVARCALAAGTATAASPLAGLFLCTVGVALLLRRSSRAGWALLLPAAGVQAAVTAAFPFWGEQPLPAPAALVPLAACVVAFAAAPHSWKTARMTAAVYGAGTLAVCLLAGPVGSNIERFALVAGAPFMLAARLSTAARPWHRPAVLTAATVLLSTWTLGKTAYDLRLYTPVPAWASHTAPLTAALHRMQADRSRVEVVPARDHREAWILGQDFHLARGWNRQLDVTRGRLFYDGTLTAATYRHWIDHWAVGHVVLHSGRPDGPAEAEAALIRSRPPWLRKVWSDAHWTVYAVRDPAPLVSAPARVLHVDGATITLATDAPATYTLRLPYSPWLRTDNGARLGPDGDFTRLTTTRPGMNTIHSRYASLP
ncbi:hypothetical protein [Streptomyces rectiverticillatus]|uniref:hypothetical protein n=1 Tax=Streptomyces rectiverticillatus TaxID=173860 RepID=UPI001FECABBF|nr:hypothetical protein [Streptomyces rectiverticillatus]